MVSYEINSHKVWVDVAVNRVVASSVLQRQNAKWQKPLADSTATGPKYVRTPMFMHIQRAHEQRHSMHVWFYR